MLLDENGNPIDPQDVDPDAPTGDLEQPKIQVPISSVAWEPEEGRPLTDLETLALAYRDGARFYQAKGTILDPQEVDAQIAKTFDEHGDKMSRDQALMYSWQLNNCLYQILIQEHMMQQQMMQMQQKRMAQHAQQVIDQANRPDKRNGKRRGIH